MYGMKLVERIATVSSEAFQVQNHVKRPEDKRVNNTNDNIMTPNLLCISVSDRIFIISVFGGGERWS